MCKMDDALFRPMQTMRRLDELQRRTRHAEGLLQALRWEIERVERGESTLQALRALLETPPPPELG